MMTVWRITAVVVAAMAVMVVITLIIIMTGDDDNYSWCIGKIHKMKCITIAFTNKT